MTIDDCSKKNSLPTLGFVFRSFPINGRETSFELILSPDDYVLEFEVNGKNDCVVGIGADSEDSGWTLGQVFLKAYYSVFDRDTESIGFVRSNPDPFKMNTNYSEQNNKVPVTKHSKSINLLKTAEKKVMIKHLVRNNVVELPKGYNGPFSYIASDNIQDDSLDDKLASLFNNSYN